MAHAAPTPPGRQRRNAIIGAVIVVVGLVCAVFAFVGLNNPKGPAAGSTTGATSTAPGTTPGTTATSTRPSTTATSTRPSTTATSTRPSTSPTKASPTTGSTANAAATIPLYIANNTGVDGLAATAEQRFEAKGWKVSQIANYSNSDIISTCAYWDATVPGAEAAAEALQREFPNIQRVKQRFDGLPDAPIVVVLNPDYS